MKTGKVRTLKIKPVLLWDRSMGFRILERVIESPNGDPGREYWIEWQGLYTTVEAANAEVEAVMNSGHLGAYVLITPDEEH